VIESACEPIYPILGAQLKQIKITLVNANKSAHLIIKNIKTTEYYTYQSLHPGFKYFDGKKSTEA